MKDRLECLKGLEILFGEKSQVMESSSRLIAKKEGSRNNVTV